MKKNIRLEDLDCANCAAKLENAVRGLDGVKDVSVNFMAQKMVLEADEDEFDALFKKIIKAARKIDSGITVCV